MRETKEEMNGFTKRHHILSSLDYAVAFYRPELSVIVTIYMVTPKEFQTFPIKGEVVTMFCGLYGFSFESSPLFL